MDDVPKYARLERERRWLVDRTACPDLSAHAHVLIEDRYIDGTRLRLRRTTDSASGEQLFKLTKKYDTGDPLARPIVTAYLRASIGFSKACPRRGSRSADIIWSTESADSVSIGSAVPLKGWNWSRSNGATTKGCALSRRLYGPRSK